MSFEKYWMENEKRFMEIARAEYEQLQMGCFVAKVKIDTDDDFALDIPYSFEVFGVNQKDVSQKLIKTLKEAKLTYIKSWSIKSDYGNKQFGDYSETWLRMRDLAIKALNEDVADFSYGGNQRMEIMIRENLVNLPHSGKVGKKSRI